MELEWWLTSKLLPLSYEKLKHLIQLPASFRLFNLIRNGLQFVEHSIAELCKRL